MDVESDDDKFESEEKDEVRSASKINAAFLRIAHLFVRVDCTIPEARGSYYLSGCCEDFVMRGSVYVKEDDSSEATYYLMYYGAMGASGKSDNRVPGWYLGVNHRGLSKHLFRSAETFVNDWLPPNTDEMISLDGPGFCSLRVESIPAKRDDGRILLVLDLDETLIHTHQPLLWNQAQPKNKIADLDEGRLAFLKDDVQPWGIANEKMRIYSRPGLYDFLKFAFKHFQVAVWTASIEEYMVHIITHIMTAEQIRKLQFFLSRDTCQKKKVAVEWENGHSGRCHIMTKPLEKLYNKVTEDRMWICKGDASKISMKLNERTLAIDNNVFTFMENIPNAVHVSDFRESAMKGDCELKLLKEWLQTFVEKPRSILNWTRRLDMFDREPNDWRNWKKHQQNKLKRRGRPKKRKKVSPTSNDDAKFNKIHTTCLLSSTYKNLGVPPGNIRHWLLEQPDCGYLG